MNRGTLRGGDRGSGQSGERNGECGRRNDGGPGQPRGAIITGERGAGKTTLCLAIAAGRDFGGIVCPGIYDKNGKIGFTCRSLSTEDEWELGRADRCLDGPRIGMYSLSSDGIARALECIYRSIDSRRITVIDEIGPLEVRLGGGFAPVLPKLKTAGHLVLVVREDLIPVVTPYIPEHITRVFDVCAGEAEGVGAKVLEFLNTAPVSS